jgi:putative SOS response-associated peptidase YedK
MCGRYTQHHNAPEIEQRFSVQETLFDPGPRYNIAPSQAVPVVVVEASSRERLVDGFQWGLVPFWAKDPTVGNKMINARAETVAEKPSFKHALKRRRCIIPADGFYEWDKVSGTKQPYHFRRKDGELFGFAGLWEEWKRPEDGSSLLTCTILTTEANETVGRIHERMPVILHPGDEALWLDPDSQDTAELLPLFVPYPDDLMEAYTVSKRINTPASDVPELLERETANSA